MLDITAIGTGLASLKTVSELVSQLRKAVDTSDVAPAELRGRLLELQDYMIDAREQLLCAQDEQLALKNRIQELERYSDVGSTFKKLHGLYWADAAPYCPTCWDVDRKPVRLGGPVKQDRDNVSYTCPLHKVSYAMYWNAKPPA